MYMTIVSLYYKFLFLVVKLENIMACICTHHIISPKYICMLKRSVHSVLLDEQNN